MSARVCVGACQCMSAYVCMLNMYVCMFVCRRLLMSAYVCMYLIHTCCKYTHMYARVHEHMYMCRCLYVHMDIFMCVCSFLPQHCFEVAHGRLYAYMYIYVHMDVCMRVCSSFSQHCHQEATPSMLILSTHIFNVCIVFCVCVAKRVWINRDMQFPCLYANTYVSKNGYMCLFTYRQVPMYACTHTHIEYLRVCSCTPTYRDILTSTLIWLCIYLHTYKYENDENNKTSHLCVAEASPSTPSLPSSSPRNTLTPAQTQLDPRTAALLPILSYRTQVPSQKGKIFTFWWSWSWWWPCLWFSDSLCRKKVGTDSHHNSLFANYHNIVSLCIGGTAYTGRCCWGRGNRHPSPIWAPQSPAPNRT